jgi:hypothetical protein
MNGWVKIHRALQSWEWYNDSQTLHVFITILLNANHDDGRWRGHEVKRGQWITGRKKLSEITGISERSIRTILKRLEDSQELTIKPTSKFSVISVAKWDSYQITEQPTDQPTANKRPASDQQVTTNKNEKKEKKEKKEIYGIGENVKLTTCEHSKLVEKLNGNHQIYIDRLSTYDKVGKYKSHYLTILGWYNKDLEKNGNNENKPRGKKLG